MPVPVEPRSPSATEAAPRPALLIAVQSPDVGDAALARSLAELRALAAGLGIHVVDTVVQKRAGAHSTRLFGKGKLEDIAARLARPASDDEADAPPPDPADPRPDLVLVDTELSPGQQRFLEQALACEVLDRTAVILRVFADRARTRVARDEIEIARLLYEAPRLRDDADLGARSGGGGGRGERGHTNAELGRQQIRRRVAALRRDIEAAHAAQETARARRSTLPMVAIVGYTNAGKSSLMRALTGSDVLVEDKLFATLGTTVRAIRPETDPRILVCDTVGFIDDLPHALVASFRSTLDEVRDADLLLYVVDAADPHRARQLAVSRETVAELGHGEAPAQVVFNKVDRLDAEARAALAEAHPEAWLISALDPEAVAGLRQRLEAHFRAGRPRAVLRVPYRRGHLLGEIHAAARVIAESYDEQGTVLEVEADPATLARLVARVEGG